jgi:cytochrome c oxidase cbb3-type subunit 3
MMGRSAAATKNKKPSFVEDKEASRILLLALVAILLVAGCLWSAVRQEKMRHDLLRRYADDIPRDPALAAFARQIAVPAYRDNCAACHGAAMQGDPQRGVPGLQRGTWLYDFARVSDLERTILYGIRSGHGKSRNVTDMPALGVTGKLSPAEIADVATYVMSLTRKGENAAAIARGGAIYQGKGECFDCHGADASGNIDWGAPALTKSGLPHGFSLETIRASIHDGRHGRCPAFINRLDFTTIRALAVMVHDASQGRTAS